MKKLFILALCAIAMTSCYNTRIIVGNVRPNEPLVEVSREWNHHLIYGLVPLDNATMYASQYTVGYDNYVVKTYMSFLNSLVGGITCGIYTPTETVYYVPLRDLNAPAKAMTQDDIDISPIELE